MICFHLILVVSFCVILSVFIYSSAVKQLIVINHIQNKRFWVTLYNVYMNNHALVPKLILNSTHADDY